MTDSLVHLVVALDAEAAPLISWFGLRRQQPDRGFPVFRHAHIALVVSGPGKANAAAATAHLHAACGFPRDALWVNIGVAGQRTQPLGTAFVAHAVAEATTGRSWYPPLAVTPPWPSTRVLTLDQPDIEYVTDDLVDMEAAGFYATACRFSTSELVQVLKVVSDNAAHPAERLTAKHLGPLLGAQLDELDLFLHRLGRLANELSEDIPVAEEDVASFLDQWRFTASQRRQLDEAVRRWQVVQGEMPDPRDFAQAGSAAEVLQRLDAVLDGQAPRLATPGGRHP